MIRHVLQSIDGVAIYPIISLVMFAVAFLSVTYLTWRMSSAEIEQASRLPLDDELQNAEGDSGQA